MPALLSFYELPDIAVYAIFMLVSAGLAAGACATISPRLSLPDRKDHLDMALRSTAAVVSALTLTLAFCAIQARTQQSEAQRLISAEVSAISGMARLADRLGASGTALQTGIRAYLTSITEQEFPGMADRGRHPATQEVAEALEHAIYATAAAMSDVMAQDLLQEADDLDTAREQRLNHATDGLPKPFWILIKLLMLLLIASGAMYPARRHVLGLLAIQAAGVGALVAFVFLMDQPFRGNLAVSPAPYHTLMRSIIHRSEVAATIRRGLMVAQPPAVAAEDSTRLAGDDLPQPRP
ncbi:bestrophin-like domain [Roseomonas sp. F4]